MFYSPEPALSRLQQIILRLMVKIARKPHESLPRYQRIASENTSMFYLLLLAIASYSPGVGTDSLRLGTNCETTALPPLFFDKGQPLVLLSPNLQPPLFMDTQEQPLEISIKWEFSVLHMSYFSKLLYQKFSRTNLNVYTCYMI